MLPTRAFLSVKVSFRFPSTRYSLPAFSQVEFFERMMQKALSFSRTIASPLPSKETLVPLKLTAFPFLPAMLHSYSIEQARLLAANGDKCEKRAIVAVQRVRENVSFRDVTSWNTSV